MYKYLKPGAVGCIRVLLSGKSSFNSRRNKGNSGISMDTFVSEVSPMEQPTPGDKSKTAMKTYTALPLRITSRSDHDHTDVDVVNDVLRNIFLGYIMKGRNIRRWKDGVPQAEGQQGAGLLVKLQMDALQLPRSHQLVRNDGC